MPHQCKVCGQFTERRESVKYDEKRWCDECELVYYIKER